MKKTLAMLLTAALSASLLSGCVTKVSDETSAASQAQTEAPSSEASETGETEASESADEAESADSSLGQSTDLAEGSTIGIGQFAEHGSLDNCREGFLAGLEEEGFVEGENLTVVYQNAQADGANASQIATSFVGRDVDLICAIATPMAQSAYSAAMETEIPVIYTAVTDPVAAELATEDGTPVGNITGTSDELPVKAQLEMIRQILPEAKTIGIMYTTSEVNSESTIAQYKELAPEYGFEIADTGIASSADVALAADSLLSQVDCVTNLTDNTVVANLPVILDKANALNIPVFGSEIEQVRIGCLAAMGLDYIELGKQTGHMAAQVLKGEAKASDMNYEVIEEAAFYGNTKVAENLGITLPEELTGQAAELFEEIAQ